MTYPNFYNNIESIILEDKLSTFLGAFENGKIEFSYLDIVKTAGHSCPTVLGAYLCTKAALKALYKDDMPQRGEIKVEFKEECTNGVAGVIANVVTDIIGATTNYGFKGLAGNFDRRHLMFFSKDISSSARFTRRDTGLSVDVFYDASSVQPEANMSQLMQKCISKTATQDEQKEFGILWQKRVENISLNEDTVIKVEEVKL